MNCMKCGQEIEEGQVFCADCLAEMKEYPVKPGTVVQLPRRKPASVTKKVYAKWRQPPTAEEQLARLKKRFRVLLVIWLVTLALLAVMAYPTIRGLWEEEKLLPGQNYTTITGTGTNETN